MARYWIGGSGNWSDTAHWSTTSGGTGGASMPTSSDDVYFDNNSTAALATINLQANRSVRSIHSSTSNYRIVVTNSYILSVYGDIIYSTTASDSLYFESEVRIQASATLDLKAGTLVARGLVLEIRSGTTTIVSNSYFYNTRVRDGAIIDMGGSYYINGLTVYSSSLFRTNNYNVVFGQYGLNTLTGAELELGTSSITLGSTGFTMYPSTIASGTFVDADDATINIYTARQVFVAAPVTIDLGTYSYGTVNVYPYSSTVNEVILAGSSQIGTLEIKPGVVFNVMTTGSSATTLEVNNLIANGTSSNQITIKSSSVGLGHVIYKSGGTVSVTYVKLQDSNATGGATFQASNSIDNGNNTGWAFIGPVPPVASFTASNTSPYRSQSVSFTDTSTGTPTSWSWSFGDGGTSTSQNPSHTYTTNGTYDVTLTATNTVGSDVETKTGYITVTTKTDTITITRLESGRGTAVVFEETATITVASFESGGGKLTYSTSYQALPQKDYEYRVFDEDWNYIATWKNVTSEFAYSQRLNENASEMQISLARSPDNRVVKLDALKDHLGANITDENSDTILVQTETANSVGPDTDVRENLNVEVYAFYGGYDSLKDEFGDDILDNTSDPIISQFGAPNGRRVYSGYIADFELVYGSDTGVNVVVVPHATEMNHYIFKSGTSTTIEYLNTDPIVMAKAAMDNYTAQGGYITYSTETMPLSGESVDYDFKLQRTREVIDKTVELLPADYYHFVDPGENKLYIKPIGSTANHTFYYEKHIKSLRLRKSITKLINDVYFTGGEVSPGVDLYVHREDSASKTSLRPGLDILSDSRVTQLDSAQVLSDRQIEEFKMARWRTTVEISDADYDIELIKLGHLVAFKNFGTFADSLVLPVVGFEKKKHSIILDLDMAIPSEAKRLEELKKQIQNEQVRNISAIPA